ncbi:hypothetical protein ACFY7C_19445 [Streptomyces sp. NPDC012769]|uniref:hypothetical protein n=1 Tax=Streptomyces sp. NPDC012769 TaxID=3364848 RepID=UPI0036BEE97D
MTTDTPYGVAGCRCYVDLHTYEPGEPEPNWVPVSTCPYHGILPRDRTDTGMYRVVNLATGADENVTIGDRDNPLTPDTAAVLKAAFEKEGRTLVPEPVAAIPPPADGLLDPEETGGAHGPSTDAPGDDSVDERTHEDGCGPGCNPPMCECGTTPQTKNWRLQDGRLVADIVDCTCQDNTEQRYTQIDPDCPDHGSEAKRCEQHGAVPFFGCNTCTVARLANRTWWDPFFGDGPVDAVCDEEGLAHYRRPFTEEEGQRMRQIIDGQNGKGTALTPDEIRGLFDDVPALLSPGAVACTSCDWTLSGPEPHLTRAYVDHVRTHRRPWWRRAGQRIRRNR